MQLRRQLQQLYIWTRATARTRPIPIPTTRTITITIKISITIYYKSNTHQKRKTVTKQHCARMVCHRVYRVAINTLLYQDRSKQKMEIECCSFELRATHGWRRWTLQCFQDCQQNRLWPFRPWYIYIYLYIFVISPLLMSSYDKRGPSLKMRRWSERDMR